MNGRPNVKWANQVCFHMLINVTSFLVFHTRVTVNIGLKEVVRMVTSIPLIRCLCYKPECIRPFSFWELLKQGYWGSEPQIQALV